MLLEQRVVNFSANSRRRCCPDGADSVVIADEDCVSRTGLRGQTDCGSGLLIKARVDAVGTRESIAHSLRACPNQMTLLGARDQPEARLVKAPISDAGRNPDAVADLPLASNLGG